MYVHYQNRSCRVWIIGPTEITMQTLWLTYYQNQSHRVWVIGTTEFSWPTLWLAYYQNRSHRVCVIGLTQYSPHALTQCEMPWFHYWCPWRRRSNLYKQGWGNLHNLIGGSQRHHEASPQWIMAPRSPQPSRVLKHPRVTRSTRD